MDQSLNIISASAGSGKTHTLTETLLRKISSGELSATELIAVTFTEAGASELKGRIRAALLSAGLYQAAQQVESAYISTIHAFGNRLLKELAFDLGIPLSTRMLNEDEQTQLIRASMIDSDALIQMTENLDEFGYKITRRGNKFVSAEDAFRSQLKSFIDLLRSTGRQQAAPDFLTRSLLWLENCYGPTETNRTENDLAKIMHGHVKALLDEFPICPIESFGVTGAGPVAEFRNSYRALESAAKFEPLLTDWALWGQLRKLKITFKGSAKAPNYSRYKELAEAVVSTANELLAIHPGPLRQCKEQLTGLINGAGQTLNGYAKRKQESKLMDYTDMVASAEMALRQPELQTRIADTIRMVVVDEFQDTNPIQFAFLWHLIGAGIPSILVGDAKQSIMGFQGADPRLFEALLVNPTAKISSLENNWRSQPALLDIINSFTQGLCSAEGINTPYQPLGPKGTKSSHIPLHMVVMEDKPKSNRRSSDKEVDDEVQIHPSERQWNAYQMAKILKRKLDSGVQVVDRKSGQPRAVRGSDIAILCPTNGMMGDYARELEKLGVPVNIERQEWFDSAEIQVCLQLLKLLANLEDKHARLLLACSDFGQMDLQQALELELLGEGIHLPVFDTLENLRDSHSTLPIKTIVELVLEETGLFDLAATWHDASQARANLIKLIGLAKEFSSAPAETLASAGFHGQGIGTFIGWLYFLKANRNEDSCPRASYNNADAVELTTWHKSKGREWPIVVVCGMDKSPKADLPSAGIGYLDFADFSQLIENSRIEFTPKVTLESKREMMAEPLRRQAEKVAMRELYVALSRPREQLVLEWLPSHLDSKAKVKKRLQILQDLCHVQVDESSVRISGNTFEAEIDRIKYQWEPREDGIDLVRDAKVAIGRRALDRNTYTTPRVAAQQNPSGYAHEQQQNAEISNKAQVAAVQVSKPIDLGYHKRANELGTLVHRAIELVMSGKDSVESYKSRLESALGEFLSSQQIEEIWTHARELRNHLESAGVNRSISVEVPVIGQLNDSTIAVGSIDLLATGGALKLIIDHKTDSKIEILDEVWAAHRSQLEVYQKLLPEYGIALNLVRSGQLIHAAEN